MWLKISVIQKTNGLSNELKRKWEERERKKQEMQIEQEENR